LLELELLLLTVQVYALVAQTLSVSVKITDGVVGTVGKVTVSLAVPVQLEIVGAVSTVNVPLQAAVLPLQFPELADTDTLE
jgi:hypothetical protein